MTSDYLETEADLRRRVESRMNARKEFGIHALIYTVVVGAMWAISGGDGWPLFTTLGWGAGLAAHGVDAYYKSGKPSFAREQLTWRAMRDEYGDHWREVASRDEYEVVRARIGERFDKRKGFAIHLAVYLCINIMLWSIGFDDDGAQWQPIVSAIWGVPLVLQFVDSYISATSERRIERELERERERLEQETAQVGKRKREQRAMTISDDGELVDLEDGLSDEPLKRKRD